MKAKLSGLTLGFAIAAGAAGPAFAGGDVIYGGIKDPGAAAVPVPVPVPVMTYEPEYYVRFDTGASWLSDGTIDETGSALEMRDPEKVETIEFGSIGAGRYITPSIRVELQVDLSTKADVSNSAVSNFTSTRSASGPTYDLDDGFGNTITYNTIDTKFYDVERIEKVQFEQDVGLVNIYYDFRNRTAFTPYVGAGVGVSYRQLSRRATEYATCTDTTNTFYPYAPGTCVNSPDLPNDFTTTSTQTKNRWDIVAAATAGVSYEITEDIIWDTSYRYLWQNGGLRLSTDTVSGTSTVEVKDIGQHQLRTGIRLNIN
jgi:opacity protein-like surface antigen